MIAADKSPLLLAALEYAEKGWRVFPLTPKSKVPMAGTTGLHEATTDPTQIVDWWTTHPSANIGLRGGSGLCIVDADCKKGKNGILSLESMDVDLDTLSVSTPSGGRHYYYSTNDNYVNSQGAVTGVDVRSEGAYVVAPPSMVDGTEYEWIDEGLTEIIPLPDQLSDLFKTFDCKDANAPEKLKMDIPPPTSEEADVMATRYVEYLSEYARPAVEGDSGHSSLLLAAIRGIHGYRLNATTVTRLLWEHYNPRCQPPWDAGSRRDAFEFERKVAEASKLTPKRISCELSAYRFEVESEEAKRRLYYFVTKKGHATYFFLRDDGEFQPMNESTARKRLVRMGLSDQKEEGERESQVTRVIHDAQDSRLLHFADYIAGYDAGMHEYKGKAFLSMRSPVTPKPKAGDWSMLRQLLVGLFVDADNLQRFLAWLYFAWEYLDDREWASLPVVALAGPPGCGKSLLVDIVTNVLGGTERGAALAFMQGDTKFNADLCGSHVLVVDDEISTTDMRIRKATGQMIKQLAVMNEHRIEPKGVNALQMAPHWRCMFATNDDAESLQVLPPIDDGLEDKILLLRCKKVQMPVKARTPRQRRKFMAQIMHEVPAMLYALQDADFLDRYGDIDRMAVTGWQDPTLLEHLKSFDAHKQLLDLIDVLNPYSVVTGYWEGTAAQLEAELKSTPATSRASERLLSWTNSTGTYLGRLAQEPDSRVSRAKPKRDRKWRIMPCP